MIKSPRVRENVKIEPAMTPGNAIGKMTVRNVCNGFAPKSLEASTNELGTRSNAVWMGIIIYGSQIYTNTINIPRGDKAKDEPPKLSKLNSHCNTPFNPSKLIK